MLYAQLEQEKMEQFLGKKQKRVCFGDRIVEVGTHRRTNRRHRRSFFESHSLLKGFFCRDRKWTKILLDLEFTSGYILYALIDRVACRGSEVVWKRGDLGLPLPRDHVL